MAYETAAKIVDEGIESLGRFYSVYKGIVVDNNDTELHQNRLKVCVPGVQGGIITWAYPKGQHGSIDSGFKFLNPKIGDLVWVTFEKGDPAFPVWEYYGWGIGQIPYPLDGPNKMGIVTPNGNIIVIDDDSGELTLNINGTTSLHVTKEILISSDSDIMITSGDTVILNNGENGGIINIRQLTQKLNQTIQELENLRNLFNTHVHSGVTTGPGTSAVPLVPISTPFSTYNKDDYEDKKAIH